MTVGRPMVLGRCGAAVAQGQVVVVSCHAVDASSLASASRGETVDLRTTTRSTTDRRSCSSADHSARARKSTLGGCTMTSALATRSTHATSTPTTSGRRFRSRTRRDRDRWSTASWWRKASTSRCSAARDCESSKRQQQRDQFGDHRREAYPRLCSHFNGGNRNGRFSRDNGFQQAQVEGILLTVADGDDRSAAITHSD